MKLSSSVKLLLLSIEFPQTDVEDDKASLVYFFSFPSGDL